VEPGRVTDRFVEALGERARAGVPVAMTVDWLGSRHMGGALKRRLRDAGVHLSVFHPPRPGALLGLDRRTHRKILVIDGRIGFTGGMGLADAWIGQGATRWRDTAVQVEGPVVAQLQAGFVQNHIRCTGTIPRGSAWFPPLPAAGATLAQAVWSSPRQGNYNAQLLYHLSSAAAERTVRITNAYFVPDRELLEGLVRARDRGVAVEVLVAGPTDVPLTRWASRLKWGVLLESGVRIFEYAPAVLHAKALVVDDRWTSVGSVNADALSFRFLDEVAVNVLDRAVASEHVGIFERDRAAAREITLSAWRGRTLGQRVREWIGRLFEPRL
jgi:cardiolipin synthase